MGVSWNGPRYIWLNNPYWTNAKVYGALHVEDDYITVSLFGPLDSKVQKTADPNSFPLSEPVDMSHLATKAANIGMTTLSAADVLNLVKARNRHGVYVDITKCMFNAGDFPTPGANKLDPSTVICGLVQYTFEWNRMMQGGRQDPGTTYLLPARFDFEVDHPRNVFFYEKTKLTKDFVSEYADAVEVVNLSSVFGSHKFTDDNIIWRASEMCWYCNLTLSSPVSQDVVNASTDNKKYSDPKTTLALKIEGPTALAPGEVVEYTVKPWSRINSDFYTQHPDFEVYPMVDGGRLSHRKVWVKNGVGKFKFFTDGLEKGELIDIKVGFKNYSGVDKLTVTMI